VIGLVVLSIVRTFARLDTVAIIERGKLGMETQSHKAAVRRSLTRPLSTLTFYLRHRRQGLAMVLIMGLMILGVACINYINLSTARSVRRAKEIGLRKTFGSGKRYLIAQLMMESLLTVIAAGLLALIFVILTMPFFNEFTQKDFVIRDLITWEIILTFIITIIITTLVAGGFPAFYMTRFEPAIVMRGHFKQKSTSGTFRKILTIVQF